MKVRKDDINDKYVSLRIAAAISVIAGAWSLIFEVYFFKSFTIEIYFARVIFTAIASSIFLLTLTNISENFFYRLIHLLLVSLISSFAITIYLIPESIYINSQILSLLIFTTAIIFSWEVKHQIVVAIYYNILFALSLITSDNYIFRLPNLFSMVLFVCFISLLSVIASAIIYKNRKKLFIKSEEIKYLFDNMPVGICRINNEGTILTSNKYLDQLLNIDFEALQTNLFTQLKSQHFDSETIFKSLTSGKISYLDLVTKDSNGADKYLNVSIGYDPNGENDETYLCLIKDDTIVKNAEREKNIALEKLFEEAKESMMNAEKALEQKNQKINLLAKINHEVRTPLNAILSFIELVQQDMLKSMDEVKDFVSSVKISAESLLHTINNFIDFAKIETGKMDLEIENFNLKEELQSISNLLIPLASMKKDSIILEMDGIIKNVVFTDRVKYRQILINLIGNSIKFTTNGKIIINVSTKYVNENLFVLETTIIDEGQGIPKEKLKDIYSPFISLKENTTTTSSSGLGLSICKEFLQMLNGKIEVQSEYGRGTNIKFSIPFEYQKGINGQNKFQNQLVAG